MQIIEIAPPRDHPMPGGPRVLLVVLALPAALALMPPGAKRQRVAAPGATAAAAATEMISLPALLSTCVDAAGRGCVAAGRGHGRGRGRGHDRLRSGT